MIQNSTTTSHYAVDRQVDRDDEPTLIVDTLEQAKRLVEGYDDWSVTRVLTTLVYVDGAGRLAEGLLGWSDD